MNAPLPQGGEVLACLPGPPLPLPLLLAPVPAGFPSPAEDYIDRHLDLNEHLVRHPAATFFVRATGTSMDGDRIRPGDILVVDRAVQPVSGRIVVAALDGELVVKRLRTRGGRTFLESANPAFPPLEVAPEADCAVWGVVTYIIHKA